MAAPFELIIFDCDGVLFDSHAANVAYYNAVLARLGQPPLSLEWEQRVHYLASSQVYDVMFGLGTPLAEAARQAARETPYEPFFDLMEPVCGLYDVLDRLRGSYRLAMATNRGSTVPEIMRRFGLDRYLELAVGVRDVPRPKPFPDVLERCLHHFRIAPHAAVYVGDADSDRAAAEAVGMPFVAVGEQVAAAYRISALVELPDLLETMRGPEGRDESQGRRRNRIDFV